ncbi:MAG: ABC transporter ATP-binding protein [Candidatus Eremiobacteraeota bacterium]|nr:ABC transporter ATP-binding protein [Candidatus Eremiobacteraeota bacterium]
MSRKSPDSPVLEVDGLVLRSARGRELERLDFRLGPGQVMGVVGPPNSGKSSLLAILAGLRQDFVGTVEVCGWPVGPGTRGLVGYVSGSPGVYEELTCQEYLEFFADAFEVDLHYRPYLIRECLRLVRLDGFQDKVISSMSYGSRRWLGMARALIHDPDLFLMDDCLARLERSERSQLVEILTELRGRGRALVLCSETLAELSGLCSHVCILVADRLLACGQVRDLLPKLVNFRMMQVQFEAGFRAAVRFLERNDKVYHLSVSTQTGNLVRFLFDGDVNGFSTLLKLLQAEGCSIVSYAEDQDFLGKAR